MACKREIAEVSLKHGGSITACHGATREGDAELVPTEMGGAWEVVKTIKRALDPNNVMNPGKQVLDEAYEEAGVVIGFRLGDQRRPSRSASPTASSCASTTSTRSTPR